MEVRELVQALELEVLAAAGKLDNDVQRGYVSDLLSDVIANSRANDIWVTLQVHQNIIAVAALKDLAGIVLTNGRQPQEDTVARATDEGIPLMVSTLPAFELVGRLYRLGIPGIAHEAP
jgi:serine kinase of HPr protein (carbohydrate metabolism regulator)